jgi:hypothetical protein
MPASGDAEQQANNVSPATTAIALYLLTLPVAARSSRNKATA